MLKIALAAALLACSPLLADEPAAASRADELRAAHADAVKRLEAALDRREWDWASARMQAAEGLYRTDRERATAAIVDAYETPKPKENHQWPRVEALVAMRHLADPAFFDRVNAALETNDGFVRGEALAALPAVARGREEEARAAVRRMVASKPPGGYAREGAFALAELGDASVLPEIREMAARGRDIRERSNALEVLFRVKDPAASLDAARWYTTSADINRRSDGARILAEFGTAEDRDLLGRLTDDPDDLVGVYAAEGVARLVKPAAATPSLVRRVAAGSLVALDSLAKVGGEEAIDALRARLASEKEPFFVPHVARALKDAIERAHPEFAVQQESKR
jgi:hypothetical protein